MRTYLLSSDKPRSGLFGELDIPKCLLTLKGDRTILDYQLHIFKGFPLDISVVIGYQGQKVIDYCNSMHYNINFLWDRTWKRKYSTSRIILDNPEFTGPLMIIFGDALFNKKVIEWVLEQKADLCIPVSSVLKFSRDGIEIAKEILAKQPNIIGFETKVFREMRERGLSIKRYEGPLWSSDVDRSEHLKVARNWAKWRKF